MTSRLLLPILLAAILPFSAPSVRAEDDSALGADPDAKPAPKSSKKAKKPVKKGYDYDRSKYRSKEPPQTTNYRFNEKGDPVNAEKKKASVKKKKRSEPPEVTEERADSCGSETSCIDKKVEADAL